MWSVEGGERQSEDAQTSCWKVLEGVPVFLLSHTGHWVILWKPVCVRTHNCWACNYIFWQPEGVSASTIDTALMYLCTSLGIENIKVELISLTCYLMIYVSVLTALDPCSHQYTESMKWYIYMQMLCRWWIWLFHIQHKSFKNKG